MLPQSWLNNDHIFGEIKIELRHNWWSIWIRKPGLMEKCLNAAKPSLLEPVRASTKYLFNTNTTTSLAKPLSPKKQEKVVSVQKSESPKRSSFLLEVSRLRFTCCWAASYGSYFRQTCTQLATHLSRFSQKKPKNISLRTAKTTETVCLSWISRFLNPLKSSSSKLSDRSRKTLEGKS